MRNAKVNRVDFVEKLIGVGLSYPQAKRAYESIIATIEDAIVSGSRVNLGRVGALVPVKKPSRAVHMGFQRGKKGKLMQSSRTFLIGSRIKYKFQLYKAFARSRNMKWFDPEPSS